MKNRFATCAASMLAAVMFVAMVFGAVPLSAEQPPAQQGQPKAKVTDATYDFGTVIEGTPVSHEFVLKNEGNANLIVQRLVPACGCTAATSTQEPIPPGAEAKIKVDFDTAGFSGEKLKTVRVLTNDPDSLSLLLSVKGFVQSDVSVEPRSVYFEEVIRGVRGSSQQVTVRVREGASVKIDSVKTYSRYLTVSEIESSPLKRTIRVEISPDAPVGELRDRVIVGISGGKESSINIPIFAAVKGDLVLNPSQLAFGVIEGKQGLMRSVKLENRGALPVSIKEVTSNHPALKTSVKEIEPGKTFVIQVQVDPQQLTKDLRAAVTVTTNREQEGTLTFNVYGLIPHKG